MTSLFPKFLKYFFPGNYGAGREWSVTAAATFDGSKVLHIMNYLNNSPTAVNSFVTCTLTDCRQGIPPGMMLGQGMQLGAMPGIPGMQVLK